MVLRQTLRSYSTVPQEWTRSSFQIDLFNGSNYIFSKMHSLVRKEFVCREWWVKSLWKEAVVAYVLGIRLNKLKSSIKYINRNTWYRRFERDSSRSTTSDNYRYANLPCYFDYTVGRPNVKESFETQREMQVDSNALRRKLVSCPLQSITSQGQLGAFRLEWITAIPGSCGICVGSCSVCLRFMKCQHIITG
jgi:hypothetical protein